MAQFQASPIPKGLSRRMKRTPSNFANLETSPVSEDGTSRGLFNSRPGLASGRVEEGGVQPAIVSRERPKSD